MATRGGVGQNWPTQTVSFNTVYSLGERKMPSVIDLNEVGGGGELLYSQEELRLQLIFQMPEGISSPLPAATQAPLC